LRQHLRNDRVRLAQFFPELKFLLTLILYDIRGLKKVTIVNEFSMVFSLDVNEVLPVLSDLKLHLSLWPIVESLVEVLSDSEVSANLKIGNFLSKVYFKISTKKEDEANVIVIEGRDDLSLEFRLSVVGRRLLESPLTLIKGRVTIKSANERLLKPYIKEFVEAYQNRLIDTLPAVLEFRRKGLIKEAVTPPEITGPKERIKSEELPRPEPKLVSVSLAENPAAFEDEVLLSKIILKSQILSTVKEELDGNELIKRVSKMYVETKLKNLYVLATDSEGNKVRVLLKDGVIVGVRIESRDGTIINGAEAVRKLNEVGKKTWKIATHSIPKELII